MSKVIKAITTIKYRVVLKENMDSSYQIEYGNAIENATSERIKDLGVASMLFDMKLRDMEGT